MRPGSPASPACSPAPVRHVARSLSLLLTVHCSLFTIQSCTPAPPPGSEPTATTLSGQPGSLTFQPAEPLIESFDNGLPTDWFTLTVFGPEGIIESVPGDVGLDTGLVPAGSPGNMLVAGQTLPFEEPEGFTVSLEFTVDDAGVTGYGAFGLNLFDPTAPGGQEASLGKFYSNGSSTFDQVFALTATPPGGTETTVIDPAGVTVAPGTRWTFELSWSPAVEPEPARLIGRVLDTATQTLLSEQVIEGFQVDFPLASQALVAAFDLGGPDPGAPLPVDSRAAVRIDNLLTDVLLPASYLLSNTILLLDGAVHDDVPVPIGQGPVSDPGVLFVGEPALTETPITAITGTSGAVLGIDGTQDVHAFLVKDLGGEPPFYGTIYSPLDEAALRQVMADHNYRTNFSTEYTVPSIFKAQGEGLAYLWNLNPPVPTLPPPQPVAVAEGFAPVGHLQPVYDSMSSPFVETFDDGDVGWDFFYAIDVFVTIPNARLAARGDTPLNFLQPPFQPGVVYQSAGRLVTEHLGGQRAAAATRPTFGIEGLTAEVKVTPDLGGQGFFVFGVLEGEGTEGLSLGCVEAGSTNCGLGYTRGTLETSQSYAGPMDGQTWTLRLSFAAGTVTGEIPEIGLLHTLPFDTQEEVQDPETGETTLQERVLMLILYSASDASPGAVQWDDLITNKPSEPVYRYRGAASPLTLGGVPYDAIDYEVEGEALQPALDAIGDPYAPDAPAELTHLFEDVGGKILGLLPGPGPARGHAVIPAGDATPLAQPIQAYAGANVDGAVFPFADGATPVHALLLAAPNSSKRSTAYLSAPLDPLVPLAPDEPLTAMIPSSDPKYRGAEALVINVFTPILDGPGGPCTPPSGEAMEGEPGPAGCGAGQPTGAYRFRLPALPPTLTGVAVPTGAILRITEGEVLPKSAGEMPVACLYQDGTIRLRLEPTELALPTPTDPFQALAQAAALGQKQCTVPLTFTSSDETVAAVLSSSNGPQIELRAPGQAVVTAAPLNGAGGNSTLRVVSVPDLSLGSPSPPVGTDSDPSDLLQFVSATSPTLELSTHLPHTATYTVKVKPQLPLVLEENLAFCSGYEIGGGAVVEGPIGDPDSEECSQVGVAVAEVVQQAEEENDNAAVGLSQEPYLNLRRDAVLDLPAGTYFLISMSLQGSARIVTHEGTVVAIQGNFTMSGNSVIEGPGVWFVGGTDVKLSGGASFTGTLVGLVELIAKGSAQIQGAIYVGYYKGTGDAVLTIEEGQLPIVVDLGLEGGGTFSVRATVHYKLAGVGPFGTDPPVVGDTVRTIVSEVALTGGETPDEEGFVTVSVPVVFDGTNDTGNPIPADPNLGFSLLAPDALIELGSYNDSLFTVHSSLVLTGGLLLVDNLAPSLTVLTPQADSQTLFASARLLVFTDDPSQSGTLLLNDLPTPDSRLTGLLLSTDPLYPTPMPDGPNAWSATATDPLGNAATLDLTQTLDSRPPEITITSPEPDSATNQSSIALEFDVSDEGQGVDVPSIAVTRSGALDGSTDSLVPSCSPSEPFTLHCSLFTPLAEGTNQLRIAASDLLGNAAGRTVTVKYDTTPPDLLFYTLNEAGVTGLQLDPLTGPGKYCTPLDLPEYLFRAVDPEPQGTIYHTSATTQFPSGFDARVPAEGFVGPLASGLDLDGIQLRVDNVLVHDSAPGSGLSACRGASILTCLQPTALGPGCHSLELTVRDHAGNVATLAQTFIADFEAPSAEVERHPPGEYAASTELDYTITYAESLPPDGCACGVAVDRYEHSGGRRLLVYESGFPGRYVEAADEEAPAEITLTSDTISPMPLDLGFSLGAAEQALRYDLVVAEGKQAFDFRTIDLVGRLLVFPVIAYSDLSVPAPLSDPPDGAILKYALPYFSLFSATPYTPGFPDPNPLDPPGQPMMSSGLAEAEIRLTIDGGPPALLLGDHEHPYLTDQITAVRGSLTSAQKGEGWHTAEATLPDRAGNVGRFSSTYCVDTQAPVVTISAPTSGEVFHWMPLMLDAIVDDPEPSCGMSGITVSPMAAVIDGPTIEGDRVTALMSFGAGSHAISVQGLDRAGNLTTGLRSISVTPLLAGQAASVTPPGVGATLDIPTGALTQAVVPELLDLSESEAIAAVGGDIFGTAPGEVKYVGGAKVDIGSQTTASPLTLCVPKPSGYSLPSDRQVWVVEVVDEDANGDGKKDLVIVDGVHESGNYICDPLPGFPGVRTSGDKMVVGGTEPTVTLTGKVPDGHTLVPHAQTCGMSNLFRLRPAADSSFAFPVCTSDLSTFAIDIVALDTGEVVGQITDLGGQPGPVIAVGTCDVEGAKPPAPSFPSLAEGGPPEVFNAVEFEFPAFQVDRNTTDLADATTTVTLTAAMKIPNPADPGVEIDYTFAREQTLVGTDPVVTAGPFDVVGYTATVSAGESKTITLAARTRWGTGFCYLVGPQASRDVTVQVVEPSGPYGAFLGAVDEGYGDRERCLPVDPVAGGESCPAIPCYAGVYQACWREGMNEGDPWRKYYAGVDPLECCLTPSQLRMMEMKRAGVGMVKTRFSWSPIEPEDVLLGGPGEPYFHFADGGYDLDSYVRMAHKYNLPVMGQMGSTPWWVSSCCEDLGVESNEEACRRQLSQKTECPLEDAPCQADVAWAADGQQCTLACLRKEAGTSGDGRTWLMPEYCAPSDRWGSGWFELEPWGKFLQFVVFTVDRFRPGGGLAQENGWTDGYGIQDWELGNEMENPKDFGVLRSYNGGDLTYYGAYLEYKEMFKAAHDTIRNTRGAAHRIHGPGPVGATDISPGCDADGNGEVTIEELAKWCHSPYGSAISVERLYQVFRDDGVGGYSMSAVETPGAVIGYHFYQREGPNPDADPGGDRALAYRFARHLSCMFEGMEVWSTEGNWCDQGRAAQDGACDANYIVAPSALAQAGYLVGLASYMEPWTVSCTDLNDAIPCAGLECPPIDDLPASVPLGLRRVFWWRDEFPRGAEWFEQTWPVKEFPILHAAQPAQTRGVILGRETEFHTGIQRGDLLPRAYFTVALEANTTYRFQIKAGRVEGNTATLSDVAVNPNLRFYLTARSPEDALFGSSLYPGWHFVSLSSDTYTTVIGPPETSLEAEYDFTFAVFPAGSYSFALVPAKDPPYVPTEGETKDFFEQQGVENRLVLLSDDHPKAPVVNPKVLEYAEGAYVEGVIRFEVLPGTSQIVARPQARAP